MNSRMRHLEEREMAVIAALCAGLIASHDQYMMTMYSVPLVYAYAIVRVAAGTVFFFAARALIEKYLPNLSLWALTALALALSHFPYALTITAFDILSAGRVPLPHAATARR